MTFCTNNITVRFYFDNCYCQDVSISTFLSHSTLNLFLTSKKIIRIFMIFAKKDQPAFRQESTEYTVKKKLKFYSYKK